MSLRDDLETIRTAIASRAYWQQMGLIGAINHLIPEDSDRRREVIQSIRRACERRPTQWDSWQSVLDLIEITAQMEERTCL